MHKPQSASQQKYSDSQLDRLSSPCHMHCNSFKESFRWSIALRQTRQVPHLSLPHFSRGNVSIKAQTVPTEKIFFDPIRLCIGGQKDERSESEVRRSVYCTVQYYLSDPLTYASCVCIPPFSPLLLPYCHVMQYPATMTH